MVRKRFQLFAVDLSTFDYTSIDSQVPLLIFSNHPGWWDPIVGMLLCREQFKDRIFYAPIDADSLRKYRVFRKLGYFGIEMNTRQGASDFIEQGSHVLNSGKGSLWVTPEGRFTDIRDHQQPLMPGIAHLAMKTPRIHCIPLAIEYVFSHEMRPLLLCKLGNALSDGDTTKYSKAEWQNHLTEHLRSTQRSLAESVIAKRWESFEIVEQGKKRGD